VKISSVAKPKWDDFRILWYLGSLSKEAPQKIASKENQMEYELRTC
jgi:hypothetical protein